MAYTIQGKEVGPIGFGLMGEFPMLYLIYLGTCH